MTPTTSNISCSIWLAMCVLSLGCFSIVSTELTPIGLMSTLAEQFQQSTANTGLLVSIYGWIAAASALLCMFCLQRFALKSALLFLMVLLAISNILVVYASGFQSILLARILGAIAHGGFWTLIGSIAYQLVAPQRIGLATAVIFSGVSVASVLAIPMSQYIAQLSDWRSVFQSIAWLAILVALLMFYTLPKLKPATVPTIKDLGTILKQPTLQMVFLLTTIMISAHFAAFTYIEVYLKQRLHFSAPQIAFALLCFGATGLIANIIAAKYLDRALIQILKAVMLCFMLSLLALGYFMTQLNLYFSLALLCLWGAATAILFIALQSYVIKIAQQHAQSAVAIYVAIFNASIGLGALGSAQLLHHMPFNYILQLLALCGIFGLFCIRKAERARAATNHSVSHRAD